jgi:hypothetical protein
MPDGRAWVFAPLNTSICAGEHSASACIVVDRLGYTNRVS